MILVLTNANSKPRAALLRPGRRFAAVCLDQASNIADALAFGNDPRLSENPGGQLRNCRHSFSELLTAWFYLSRREYNKCEREESLPQRGIGGITKGNVETYTLRNGRKNKKVETDGRCVPTGISELQASGDGKSRGQRSRRRNFKGDLFRRHRSRKENRGLHFGICLLAHWA